MVALFLATAFNKLVINKTLNRMKVFYRTIFHKIEEFLTLLIEGKKEQEHKIVGGLRYTHTKLNGCIRITVTKFKSHV